MTRAVAALTAILVLTTMSMAATPFARLVGAWSGSGQISYADGQSERVRCTAYYTEAGGGLHLAIRCRSETNEVEVRGLLIPHGDRLTGTWQERTFNVSGDVTGRLAAGRISLTIAGGGLSGSMSVAYSGSRQTVVISVEGVSMKSVKITLTKS